MTSMIRRLIGLICQLSILKTLRFNFYYFPLKQAIVFPIFIYKGVELYRMRGGGNNIFSK